MDKDLVYDYIRYEDEQGNRVSDKMLSKFIYNNKPLFKCWIVSGKIVQIEKIN